MLEAKEIHKFYGALHVLKGVELTINKGEIASIVGPSGSGKSTLLHILGTLDHPDKGEVLINNKRIDFQYDKMVADFRNTHIGFVFNFIIYYLNLQPSKMYPYRDGLPAERKKK